MCTLFFYSSIFEYSHADYCYRFAPVTIISGVYGMNVSQISSSNTIPNISQFFAAIANIERFDRSISRRIELAAYYKQAWEEIRSERVWLCTGKGREVDDTPERWIRNLTKQPS